MTTTRPGAQIIADLATELKLTPGQQRKLVAAFHCIADISWSHGCVDGVHRSREVLFSLQEKLRKQRIAAVAKAEKK